MSWTDYKQILFNIIREVRNDNVTIIAAGVAFYSLLALFPLISACISLFGYIADPHVVEDQLLNASMLMPTEAWQILHQQVMEVVSTSQPKLGLGIIIGLLLAIWSAGSGIRAIMRAMNIAYEEREKRTILSFYGLAAIFTLSISLFSSLALIVIIGIPALLKFLHFPELSNQLTQTLPWTVTIVYFALATTLLYRYGPSRRSARLVWILPGVIFATVCWVLISIGFTHFVAEFETYNRTYGSISAVIILQVWMWLTATVIIMGAEINAELEKYTQYDTTIGPERPIGERGAVVADYTPYYFGD